LPYPKTIAMYKMIDIIVPAYNEEQNISLFIEEIDKLFAELPYKHKIIFVNDGSSDNTLLALKIAAKRKSHVSYISFSRNFGKDAALKAGLQHATGDAAISIDADLQHPVALIPEMLAYWEEGYEVIYAARDKSNEHVSLYNKLAAKLFYKTINLLADVKIEDGCTDFKLMDRKVVQVLNSMQESDPYFKGLTTWVGFKQKSIPYSPNERKFGATKFSQVALMKLAVRGITSFSVKPLLIAIYIGLSISLISTLYIPYVIYSLVNGYNVSGWASTIVTIAFFGGLQLMILGIIGLYLGKTFMHGKQRPHYIISESSYQVENVQHVHNLIAANLF